MISRKVLFIILALVIVLSVSAAVIMLWTQGGVSKETFQFDGIERTYYFHVPSSYDGRTSVPLVIVLHGYSQGPSTAQVFVSTAKSDKEGFIVAYPQGVGAAWNVGFGSFNSSIDDVGFINELINRLEQKYIIDPKRIYVSGFSNGAMMAYRLGAELSDKIAAIAPVAGSIGGMTGGSNVLRRISEPSQPVSVIVFHGTADTSIPYEGDGYLSVVGSVAFWVRCDSCSTNPQNETSSDGKVIKSAYTGGKNSTEVVLYTIVGGTHTWPTTPAATDIIWDFFASHPKK